MSVWNFLQLSLSTESSSDGAKSLASNDFHGRFNLVKVEGGGLGSLRSGSECAFPNGTAEIGPQPRAAGSHPGRFSAGASPSSTNVVAENNSRRLSRCSLITSHSSVGQSSLLAQQGLLLKIPKGSGQVWARY